MSAAVIARRYAQALLNLAAKEKQIEDVAQGLDDVAGAISASGPIREVLNSPQIGTADRNKVIAQLLDQAKAPPLLDKFIRFLAHKRRLPLVVEVQAVFHDLADARLGRAQAELVVASPIGDKEQSQLRKIYERLSGRTISLSVRVDPDILGGAVTRIGSTVWDGSLRNSLQAMRNTITKSH